MDSTVVIVIFAAIVLVGVVIGIRLGRRPAAIAPDGNGSAEGRNEATSVIRFPKPAVQPYLIANGGAFNGKPLNLTGKQITIGRSPDNAIVVDEDLVSREHALIELQREGYVLHDRGSTNGTYVNGQQIYQHLLQPGDQIQIGPVTLALTLPGQSVAIKPNGPAVPKPVERPKAYELGQYELKQLLGEGGAAKVYYGISKRDQRPVAIKILNSTDPYFLSKFKMELEIGQTLRHPYITAIYGGGQTRQGAWYIVMELNDGRSLRDRLPQGHALPVEEAIRIIGQTCDALMYAHRRGVYHRDLKPENLMFSSNHAVKLSDFGIARIAARKTVTSHGMLVGTAEYMSVEQARGREIDGRSDLYSLGIVLYEMLTGRRPFEGTEPLAIWNSIFVLNLIRPARSIQPCLPGWMAQSCVLWKRIQIVGIKRSRNLRGRWVTRRRFTPVMNHPQ